MYEKPQIVLNGAAISAIEAELAKNVGIEDLDGQHTEPAYRSDE